MWLLSVSRPRFWLYLMGPFAVGYVLGVPEEISFLLPSFWAWLAYWAFPANLLLYGVNDIADEDTDQHNQKKEGYEHRLHRSRQAWLLALLVLFQIPVIYLLWNASFQIMSVYLLWIVLSCFYSLPPVRLKARPFLDSLSNGLYILPGVLGFFLAGGRFIIPILFIGAWFWAMAMHSYSAIPDIKADSKANIQTTATYLGAQKTLFYCGFLWTISAIFLCFYAPILGAIAMVLYGGFIVLGLRNPHNILHHYTYFPLVNGVFGMLLFWWIFYPLVSERLFG